jgi:hypothetical protein
MTMSTMRDPNELSPTGGTMPFNIRRGVLTCVAAFILFGCGAADSTAPEERPVDGLRLLTVTADAPALAATVTSFYAVRGRNAGVDLWYRPKAGSKDSTKFLEFRLDNVSLDRRPNGTAFAEGDSVLITLTVTDPKHLIVDFQPSGLKFAAKNPGRLKMFFAQCGEDLDGSGNVDGNDDAIANQLSIWRQESVLAPWIKVASVEVKSNKEIDADIAGFTGYAIAY